MLSRLFLAVALTALFAASVTARAQTETSTAPAPAPASQLLKTEQLEQLLAPIALYPDPLLSETLIASTYPLEVVEAERWVKANKNLKGEQLQAALEKKNWDKSVKSLAQTPAVLDMMSSKLDWTQKLGDAVLAQQGDVMAAVQSLRARAQGQNKLQTTKEQKVSVRKEPPNDREIIVIEPATPNTVYVPYYEPAAVYGAWPYAAYPPYYFAAPVGYGYPYGAGLASAAIGFGVGWAVGAAWGGGFGWGGNDINISRGDVNINRENNKWSHNSDHRKGVRYNNSDVAKKFDKGGQRAGADQRKDFRGHNRDQAGGRDGARDGNRGQTADRGSGSAGNRASGERRDAGKSSSGKGNAGKGNAGRQQAGQTRQGQGGQSRQAQGGQSRQAQGGQSRRSDNAFANSNHGRSAAGHADRGRASMASAHRGGGGRQFSGGGGGGRSFSGGGGGRGGFGGGGRGGGGRGRR